MPLDERRDGADALAVDEVTFPMARNGTIFGFCGSFADVHQVADLALTGRGSGMRPDGDENVACGDSG